MSGAGATDKNGRVEEAPHYWGHRERLRERFEEAGPAALQDYELLELLLFHVNRRGDTKGQAKALLKEFGSLQGVLGQPAARLQEIKGVGPAASKLIGLVNDIAARTARDTVRAQREVLSSWDAVIAYARRCMAELPREEFRVLFLDRKNRLIRDEVQGHGTVDHAPVYVREVIKRALELSASALVLVHNHPSGDPQPSQADIDMTRLIISLAEPMGLTVHDHIIVGRHGHVSLKAEGHL